MFSNWTMIALGLWTMISPWILGFSSISLAKWNALVIGLILVVVNMWIIFDEPREALAKDVRAGKGRSESKVKI